MKKILSFLLLLNITLFAQHVNVKQSVSGGGGGNNIMSLNSYVCQYSNEFVVAYNDMMSNKFFVKFNTNGDTVFSYNTSPDGFAYFSQAADGKLYSFDIIGDTLVTLKTNTMGKGLWKRKTTLPNGGSWWGIASTHDNQDLYFAIGSSYWSSGSHILFGKQDSSGARVFTKSVDLTSWLSTNTNNVTPNLLKKTPSGNFVMVATTYANPGTNYMLVMEFSPIGNVLWAKAFNLSTTLQPFSLDITSNNQILISGSKSGTAYMKLDQNGNFKWGKAIADNVYKCDIIELSNRKLALHLSHSNQVVDGVSKNMISILDSSGNVLLTRSFGSTNVNEITGLKKAGLNSVAGIGIANNTQEFFIYEMDTLGTSVGCFDVINSLPVTTWTASSVSQPLVAVTETSSAPVNKTFGSYQHIAFMKSAPGISANGIITPPLCHGYFGNVNVNPSGGASPYNYKWSNGTNSQNLLNVPGGVYTVRVADNAGCVLIDTFNVVEPTLLSTTYTVTHVTCFGAQNGSINVTTNGGTPGYTFQWTTQATTEDLSGLSGGFYQLTVTDNNGCQKVLAVSVNEPQQLIAGIFSSQNVKCHGACDGSLTGLASGGTQPYTYQWNNPGNSTTASVSNLCPGNYLFSVTDSKNCTTFANAVITEPSALSITTTTVGSLCGVSTGEAAATVTGGVSPYTYQWSTTSTNDTAFNLSAGTYSVNVHDANNCAISSSANVGLVTPTPQLCMVTVDSLSSHNILLWDKTGMSHIAYFNIYREDITNNYTLIAAVNYDSLSEYHDYDTLMADPNITTKRYKISAVDSCGNESVKSNFHNTIFISHTGGTFNWNTYTIQNNGTPVTSYLLMRDDLSNGNWQQIGSTAGTQNLLNDPNYSSFQTTASWRIETVWGISCTPTFRESNGVQGAVIKSKSNITSNRAISVKENAAANFVMFPNPATDVLQFETTKVNCQLEIVNALGAVVMQSRLSETNTKISIADLAAGVYYVKVTTPEKQSFVRKLIVE